MKAKELRERTPEALTELEKQLEKQLFDSRFKNYTNRLNDTACIRGSPRSPENQTAHHHGDRQPGEPVE